LTKTTLERSTLIVSINSSKSLNRENKKRIGTQMNLLKMKKLKSLLLRRLFKKKASLFNLETLCKSLATCNQRVQVSEASVLNAKTRSKNLQKVLIDESNKQKKCH